LGRVRESRMRDEKDGKDGKDGRLRGWMERMNDLDVEDGGRWKNRETTPTGRIR
jgi:hypothetical protein